MKCLKCGKNIDQDSKYCTYCGEEQNHEIERKVHTNKKASSDKKIVVIILGIIGILTLLVIFAMILLIAGIANYEGTKKVEQKVEYIDDEYNGGEPVLQRDYKVVNKVTTESLADISYDDAIKYLKEIGFSNVKLEKELGDTSCTYEVTAVNKPYTNLYIEDKVDLCFDKNNKMNELDVELYFIARDFTHENMKKEIMELSSNFHNLKLNEKMMNETYDDLKRQMQSFEDYPFAVRFQEIQDYDITYELKYSDENRYNPAVYNVELDIELDK